MSRLNATLEALRARLAGTKGPLQAALVERIAKHFGIALEPPAPSGSRLTPAQLRALEHAVTPMLEMAIQGASGFAPDFPALRTRTASSLEAGGWAPGPDSLRARFAAWRTSIDLLQHPPDPGLSVLRYADPALVAHHHAKFMAKDAEVVAAKRTRETEDRVWVHPDCPGAAVRMRFVREHGPYTRLAITACFPSIFAIAATDALWSETIWRCFRSNYSLTGGGEDLKFRASVWTGGRDGTTVVIQGLNQNDASCQDCTERGAPMMPVNIQVDLDERMF
jgi:hypothetical protein